MTAHPTGRRLRCCTRGVPVGAGALVALALLAASACSGDDSREAATDTSASPETTAEVTAVATTAPAGGSPVTDPVASTSSLPAVAPGAVTSPEQGVPGLDSDEVACRSWSRWAGSYQVVLVWATFGDGDPLGVTRLEVLAAPVVTEAYREFLANLPDELVPEADLLSEDYLGRYTRRADRALVALRSAGADPATVSLIADAWLEALSRRDPSSPDVTVDLPADVESVVLVAAADLDAQLVPVPLDPSLVTDVEVPLTTAFLERTCPDGGTLAGAEVVG